MLRRIRDRLTYANVMATVAVFIALGGVSYAAVKLPKNSVGPAQIKKNAVTGSKVKNSSLTGADVKNSSVTGSDVKDGSLTAKDFSGSIQGPQGPQGAKGDTGPQGNPGPVTGELPSGVTLRGTWDVSLPNGAWVTAAQTAISFGLRLPSEPAVHVVPRGGPKPAECQGTVYMPEAAPGNFCLYRQWENGFGAPLVLRLASQVNPDELLQYGGYAGRTGVTVTVDSQGTSFHNAHGSWAVTAP